MRVLDKHTAGFAFYPANAPRTVSQQHDVTGVALHREIFIDCADNNSIRLRNYGKQRRFRNSPAAGDGGQPTAAASTQPMIHAIAMEISAVASSPGRNSLGEHFENGIIGLTREITVWVGTLD